MTAIAEELKPEIIYALSISEFSKIHNIPKYTVIRNDSKFQWAEQLPGTRRHILDNEFNRLAAIQVNQDRVTRETKKKPKSKKPKKSIKA